MQQLFGPLLVLDTGQSKDHIDNQDNRHHHPMVIL